MLELNISPNFTGEDIRKVCEYNYRINAGRIGKRMCVGTAVRRRAAMNIDHPAEENQKQERENNYESHRSDGQYHAH